MEGKPGSGLFDHTKTEMGAAARYSRIGCDLTIEGNWFLGLDPLEERICLDPCLEASQDGLSPPTHQVILRPKDKVSSKGLEPKAHASGPWRLEEAGSSFISKPRALVGLPYNRRGGKERGLAFLSTGDYLADMRYDQYLDLIFSTSSPSVLD